MARGRRLSGHIRDIFRVRSNRPKQKSPDFRGFLERMKGLEPSTFCMASSGRQYGTRIFGTFVATKTLEIRPTKAHVMPNVMPNFS